MRTIDLTTFLAQHKTMTASVEALSELGIKTSYWTVRRWRNNLSWPCAAMKQLLAQVGIKA